MEVGTVLVSTENVHVSETWNIIFLEQKTSSTMWHLGSWWGFICTVGSTWPYTNWPCGASLM